MRALNAVEEQALTLLKAANGSLNLKQMAQRMGSTTAHDLKVALDTLTLRDLVERIDTGRDVTFAALVSQAPAPVPPAPPSAARDVPTVATSASPTSSAAEQNCDRVLRFLKEADPEARTGREIFDALGITQSAFSLAVRALEARGQVIRTGRHNAPLYALSPSAAVALTRSDDDSGSAVPAESTPGLANPAVQPIDTATSTAASAVCATLATVTEPAGPRDGLSSFEHAGDFEPAADELLAWHQQRAEQEAERRQPAFALPNAMRNTGDDGAADLAVTGCVLIDTASFALWSDGRLEIDAGSDHVTLSQPATRALLDYLDRVCAIEQH
ncbi:MAG: hypothetical protein NTZ11_10765 [Gammaproteobacteria bacterium]|nr:hypothetical protein [Gammaproteobacteria bacterium]